MTPPTSFRAEAIGFVPVVVLSSGTPAVAIISALSGAAVILITLKGEGEFTWRALCVSTQREQYCRKQPKKTKYRL